MSYPTPNLTPAGAGVNTADPLVNTNQCNSFNMTFSGKSMTLSALSGFIGSEVLINNKSGSSILIYDKDNATSDRAFLLENSESTVIRGITNTNQVSVQGFDVGLNGKVYFRSAFFSNMNQR